jgi:hypothetical protein
MTIEAAEAARIDNPDCSLCPRKWARRLDAVNELLRHAIAEGYFVTEAPNTMPQFVWARDPDDPNLVYKAKLTEPPNGYKAFPLTQHQANYSLPFELP